MNNFIKLKSVAKLLSASVMLLGFTLVSFSANASGGDANEKKYSKEEAIHYSQKLIADYSKKTPDNNQDVKNLFTQALVLAADVQTLFTSPSVENVKIAQQAVDKLISKSNAPGVPEIIRTQCKPELVITRKLIAALSKVADGKSNQRQSTNKLYYLFVDQTQVHLNQILVFKSTPEPVSPN